VEEEKTLALAEIAKGKGHRAKRPPSAVMPLCQPVRQTSSLAIEITKHKRPATEDGHSVQNPNHKFQIPNKFQSPKFEISSN
jgi:hypothetical protein